MVTLTTLDTLCGVTAEDVQREIPRTLIRDGIATVDPRLGPALADAVARNALGVDHVELLGISMLGRQYRVW